VNAASAERSFRAAAAVAVGRQIQIAASSWWVGKTPANEPVRSDELDGRPRQSRVVRVERRAGPPAVRGPGRVDGAGDTGAQPVCADHEPGPDLDRLAAPVVPAHAGDPSSVVMKHAVHGHSILDSGTGPACRVGQHRVEDPAPRGDQEVHSGLLLDAAGDLGTITVSIVDVLEGDLADRRRAAGEDLVE